MHFTTQVNKASPLLMLACATGQHIKKAVLFVRKSGGDQQEYYKVTTVTTCSSPRTRPAGPREATPLPVDQFSLNFAKIEFEYKPQKPDGSLDSAVTAGLRPQGEQEAVIRLPAAGVGGLSTGRNPVPSPDSRFRCLPFQGRHAMTANELFQTGRLREAIDAQVAKVKSAPDRPTRPVLPLRTVPLRRRPRPRPQAARRPALR